jgi:transcriptional regulator with XRE-family HTH domain
VSTEVFEPQQRYPNDGVRDRFAFNLRRARRAAGITQEALGARCDLHRTEISLLERAGREPRLGTIVRLAGALGVATGTLCEGMTWEEDRQRFEFPPD